MMSIAASKYPGIWQGSEGGIAADGNRLKKSTVIWLDS
jgi:hypothetical protein